MPESLEPRLSRRERQIMNVLFRRGEGTVADVMDEMPDPPSYSAVRAMLRTLEDKGHVKHHEDGPRYVYKPTVAKESARQTAVEHLVQTFFDGSTAQAVAALLDGSARALTKEERARLTALIRRASEEGR
ncbi:MAG TPA: BlaI/MecI/CopY family transcriptional regulator [Gemmatimonadaceae bacterium]|nr:BlaI/MecI/CopY family transcriptional regulator [Gemmatimonadaceae bacterium]